MRLEPSGPDLQATFSMMTQANQTSRAHRGRMHSQACSYSLWAAQARFWYRSLISAMTTVSQGLPKEWVEAGAKQL